MNKWDEQEHRRLRVTSEYVPFTPDQIDPTIEHIWKLARTGRYHEANTLVDKLLHDVSSLISSEDRELLTKLAATQHLAGYVKSQTTRANQAAIP
jgi:ATP/maltotriose-dependent transcriptional regulator MalT